VSHSDHAVAEIAKLEISSSMVPTQHEVKEFVQKFSSLATRVDEFRKFSDDFNKKHSIRKYWDSDVARDQMLSNIAVVGDLSILANKLLALNVVFAQRIDGQTSAIAVQSIDIAKNQADLKDGSAEIRRLQQTWSVYLDALNNDLEKLRDNFEVSRSELNAKVEASLNASSTSNQILFKAKLAMWFSIGAFMTGLVSLLLYLQKF
jgi:hypothetical protein